VARVVDFGVARAASRLSTTRSGQLKGKLAYMAPEQARGGTVDRRADLFACGIVLWEALATKRLFKGDGEAETLNRVLYDPIVAPSTVRPDVPKGLEVICMKALSRDVDERYPTAQDFGDALEKAARALDSVGSVRDVAECLQDVIGADLSQQRDAVRAWLARSEPSENTGPRTGPRSKPVLDSIVTRVDGGAKSEPSSTGRRENTGARGERASSPPEKVSSVSSAVILVPSSVGPTQVGASPPSRARTGGRVVLVVLAAIVLMGVGAWGAKSLGSRTAANGGVATNAPSAVAPLAPTQAASVAAPAGSEPAPTIAASVASATPSAPASAQAVRPGTRPAGRPAGSVRPATTKGGGGVPDELNNNPYR
jgi:serine/threonine-protein kinase